MRVVKQEALTCEQHGRYLSTINTMTIAGRDLMVWSTGCPTCEDERYAKKQREEDTRVEKERRDRISTNRKAAGIPTRFSCCTFDSYFANSAEQRHALSVAKGFAEKFEAVRKTGSNLTFCGNSGCGKTHLACAIANHLLDAERTVIYTQAIELLRAIRETWRRGSSHGEGTVINRYRNVGLLVLDEVGISFGSEAEKTQLFDVLDGRYREMRPTLIVSNLNAKGLQECLGSRIYDRMMENGSAVVIFSWKSYRGEHHGDRSIASTKAATTEDQPPVDWLVQ